MEETKQTMKTKRKYVKIKTEPVVEDKDSSEKVEKPKKVKSNKNIKNAKGSGKEKAIKPKKEPVDDHQLNSDKNSLKPKANMMNLKLNLKQK